MIYASKTVEVSDWTIKNLLKSKILVALNRTHLQCDRRAVSRVRSPHLQSKFYSYDHDETRGC